MVHRWKQSGHRIAHATRWRAGVRHPSCPRVSLLVRPLTTNHPSCAVVTAATAAWSARHDPTSPLSPGAIVAGALLLTCSTALSIVPTECEVAEKISVVERDKATVASEDPNVDGDEEDDDPYANLPEEDEETDCTLCNTFRNGPCRPFWRKLEHCFKDHEGEGGEKCMRYFTPHQMCLMDYTNLYQLVSLNTKQSLVDDANAAVADHEQRCWLLETKNGPSVDWSSWRKFYDEMGPSFSQTIPTEQKEDGSSSPNTTTIPLWKRLPENTEPILITSPVSLDRIEPEREMILKLAWAVDQNDRVIGLSFNKQYGDMQDEAKGSVGQGDPQKDGDDVVDQSSETKTGQGTTEPSRDDADDSSSSTKDEASEEPLPTTLTFDVHVLPGEVSSIRVFGMYSENPVDVPAEKDILDVLLYQTKSFDLHKIGSTKEEGQ